ncbi:MAG: proton-conducting transporter membrane subunit [Aquificaceae bacterium]|nr:hypothetical protein [Aquificaceae bacterium]MDW8422727.1 proton-conducting transporter membrane subunit [Aquificaceae bacterium]
MSLDLGYLVAFPILGGLLSLIGRLRLYAVFVFGLLSCFLSFYAFLLSLKHGKPLYQWVGGWIPPLGIGLRLDGLSGFFLMFTAVVFVGVGVYSLGFFKSAYKEREEFFWFFFFFLWAGLNAFFLSEDLFNLYVSLEVLSLTAGVLVALPGHKKAVRASLNYLLLSLFASLLYLFGVAIIYASYGSLSMHMLAKSFSEGGEFLYSLLPLIVSLSIKSALFPFHFWLPPAHSSTIAPASALLSSLVVKPPAYLLLRVWIEVFPKDKSLEYVSWVLGLLGALAIFFGSYYAIRQKTIKMLLAYSTVAQMGYLFLIVPLYYKAQYAEMRTTVIEGFTMQAFSHALAKASMFLASGNAIYVSKRDDISYMPGFAHSHPFTFFALFFSGATLVGLPLSGGFFAKFLLIKASFEVSMLFQGVVLLLGSLLAALYVYPIWRESLSFQPEKIYHLPIPRLMEVSAFALGFVAFSSGLVAGFLLQALSGV